MITERILKKWRKEALEGDGVPLWTESIFTNDSTQSTYVRNKIVELNSRICRMTQELMDQHLLRKD